MNDLSFYELLTHMTVLLQNYVAANLLWVCSITLIKLSILHLYLQIFSLLHFRKWVYIVGVFVVLYFIGVVLTQFLICRPFAKNWDPLMAGTCGDSMAAALANAIIDLVIDVAILALPMPLVWSLHMPLARRLKICAAFGLGTMYVLLVLFFPSSHITYTWLTNSFASVSASSQSSAQSGLPAWPGIRILLTRRACWASMPSSSRVLAPSTPACPSCNTR